MTLRARAIYRLGISGEVAWTAPGGVVDVVDALYGFETRNSPTGPGCSQRRLGPRGFLELEQGRFQGAVDLIDDPADTSPPARLG